jgi:hypothetical protein
LSIWPGIQEVDGEIFYVPTQLPVAGAIRAELERVTHHGRYDSNEQLGECQQCGVSFVGTVREVWPKLQSHRRQRQRVILLTVLATLDQEAEHPS